MIKLKNNHSFDFACSSGALGFYGEGYFWEKPLLWSGIINTQEFTIISKTLTFKPRKGNFSWFCPWKTVKIIPDGVVNCLGLPNPGYRWWLENYPKTDNKIIASILPETVEEAKQMAKDFNFRPLVGLELNFSCPNTEEIKNIVKITETILENTMHPVIIKLGYTQPYKEICLELDGKVAAFDLINSVPWHKVYDDPSPLNPHIGGVSGKPIIKFAREALAKTKVVTSTPIISGGGIETKEEVFARRVMGASAVTFGSLFLRKPWMPNKIIKDCKKAWSK